MAIELACSIVDVTIELSTLSELRAAEVISALDASMVDVDSPISMVCEKEDAVSTDDEIVPVTSELKLLEV